MRIALYMGGDMARGSKKALAINEPIEVSPPSFRVTEDRWVRMMGVRFLVKAGTESSKVEPLWIDQGVPYEVVGGSHGVDV